MSGIPDEAVSVALDAWHVACHAEETQLQGMQRVIAAALPVIERDLRNQIADEVAAQTRTVNTRYIGTTEAALGYCDGLITAARLVRGATTDGDTDER